MKKKFVTLLLALTCAVGLTAGTACGGKDDPSDSVTSENGSLSTWESYFVFDNVTATRTTVQNFAGSTRTYTVAESMKIADGQWQWVMLRDYGGISPSESYGAYWDGTQVTTQNANEVLTDEVLYDLGNDFFAEAELLKYGESNFTETASGVFEASAITEIESSSYTDVKIVVIDGNVAEISYKHSFSASGDTINEEVTMSFLYWGETTVTPL